MFKKTLIASVLAVATMGAFAQAPATPAPVTEATSPVHAATTGKHVKKNSKHKTKVSHTKAKTHKTATQPVS
jgi:hypothetical protein